jgi:hypothetical protein
MEKGALKIEGFASEQFESLKRNLDLLRIEEVNYGKVMDDVIRVEAFYNQLKHDVRDHIAASKLLGSEMLHSIKQGVPEEFWDSTKERYELQVAMQYPPFHIGVESVLLKKFFQDPPDVGDMELVSVGHNLLDRFGYVSVATRDCHLSPIRFANGLVEPYVSNRIKGSFQVECDCPEVIAGKLKKLIY